MTYRSDLETHLRESYKLIREYENIARLTSSPKEKALAQQTIGEQWEIIKGFLDEYIPLCQRLGIAPAEDIAELATHFPQYIHTSSSAATPAQPLARAINIFLSYAHEDEDLCSSLVKHMQLLKREGLINEWYNRRISAGAVWADEIKRHFEAADLILLLISADYIASDDCYSSEMLRALQRHQAGTTRVVPIILRPTDWCSAPFGALKSLPLNDKPLTMWPNRDQAFFSVVSEIREIVKKMNGSLS